MYTQNSLFACPPDDRPPQPHPQCSALATHGEYRCNSRTDRRVRPPSPPPAIEEDPRRRMKEKGSLPLSPFGLSPLLFFRRGAWAIPATACRSFTYASSSQAHSSHNTARPISPKNRERHLIHERIRISLIGQLFPRMPRAEIELCIIEVRICIKQLVKHIRFHLRFC